MMQLILSQSFFTDILIWILYLGISKNKINKSQWLGIHTEECWAPLPWTVSRENHAANLVFRLATNLKKKHEFEQMVWNCSALWGSAVCWQTEEVASLAWLEADSSGKLWAEVDKDIRVAARTPADSGRESRALCDSKYLVLWNSWSESRRRTQRH